MCRPAPVLTKTNFVKRYEQGEFGNHSPTWSSYADWFYKVGYPRGDLSYQESQTAKYHIRNRVPGAMTWYDVPGSNLFEAWEVATAQFEPEQLYISEMCPTELTTIQGEVVYDQVDYLQLRYSTIAKPMRQALSVEEGEERHAKGIAAEMILRRYMNPRSYGWLRWLLTGYPHHVVEFTCLSRCWGTEPGHNTLFWECRLY